MNLTEHFTLEELTDSDTAVRLGIDNTPPAAIRPNLEVLARGLERVRRILGQPIIVKSGYRCEALEKVLCARDYAAWCKRLGKRQAAAWREYFERKSHPRGYGADFICPRFGTPVEIVRALKNAGITSTRSSRRAAGCMRRSIRACAARSSPRASTRAARRRIHGRPSRSLANS